MLSFESHNFTAALASIQILLVWKQVSTDVLCQSNMTTAGVAEFTPTVDFDVWTHWWNSTGNDQDPLGGRPYPSLYSWTHIGLSAFVVTAIIGAGSLGSIEVRDWAV